MAAVGMRYLVGAVIKTETEGAVPTYDKGFNFGRAVSANVTFTRNDAKLYVDDVLGERDNTITGGNVDITVAEILDEIAEKVFGDKKDSDAEGDYYDSSESSPYIGLGYMQEVRVKGVSKYRVTWLYKVQLAPAESQAQTKGETTQFQTQRVTGEMMGVSMSDGSTRFRARNEFDTSAKAVEWLKKKANITVS